MDKQKQMIEEMEIDIIKSLSVEYIYAKSEVIKKLSDISVFACSLIAKGYRKIPENAVVLTREEYQMLNYFNHRGEELLKQERKETAEKFAERLKAKQAPLDEYDEISIGCLFADIDEILKEITEDE